MHVCWNLHWIHRSFQLRWVLSVVILNEIWRDTLVYLRHVSIWYLFDLHQPHTNQIMVNYGPKRKKTWIKPTYLAPQLPSHWVHVVRNPYHIPRKRQDKIHPRAVSNVHLFIQVGQIRLSAIWQCGLLRNSNSSQMHPLDGLCNLVSSNLTFWLKKFNLFMHSWRNLESWAVGIGGCWDLLSGSSYGGAVVKFSATAVAAKKELAPQLPCFSGE